MIAMSTCTHKPHRKHGLSDPLLWYMHLNRFSWSWMNFQNLWIGFSKPIETKGKNNDPQRFQILQTFQVQKKILEGYSFLPKEFPEKWCFKIATAYASLPSSLPGTFKNTWTQKIQMLNPGFKYHLSITPLNTFQASQTYPNRGCLSHCFRHNPQCLRVGPSLNLDTG